MIEQMRKVSIRDKEIKKSKSKRESDQLCIPRNSCTQGSKGDRNQVSPKLVGKLKSKEKYRSPKKSIKGNFSKKKSPRR